MTLSQARQAVTRQLAGAYASFIDPVDPANSLARVELTPIQVRDVQFLVQGEVGRPGSYALDSSLANLVYALARAGGVKETASLRHIQIRRGGKTRRVDFYDFLLEGTLDPNSIQIQPGDVIFVPLKKLEVAVRGEVRRPARYELLPDEHLLDLIAMAGGLKPTASLEKVLILRTEMNKGLETVDVNLEEALRTRRRVPLQDQDVVNIFSTYLLRIDFVAVEGQGIALPGEYQLREGMRIRDLIEMAGGLTGLAYTRRADLVRTRPDMTRHYRSVDLEKALAGDPEHDLELASMDRLIVYTVQEIEGAERFVRLRGHVKNPGRFELYRGMRLYDLLFAKGGFQDRDFLKKTYTRRGDILRVSEDGSSRTLIKFDLEKLLAGDPAENHLLQADDEIIVYSMEEVASVEHYVELSGHVKRPGRYRLWEGMSVLDLLDVAGGFQDRGFRKETFLERADIIRRVRDGQEMTRRLIRFNLGRLLLGDDSQNHRLEAGDEIVVYAAEDFTTPQTVAVDGFVKKPGVYAYAANMTLGDLLVQAGGLLEGAYARAEIFRLDTASANPGVERQVIQVDIDREFYRSEAVGIPLKNNDHVFVRKHPDYQREAIVELRGEVRFPGRYVLKSERERLSDLIARAGGLKDSAYPPAARLLRLTGVSGVNDVAGLPADPSAMNVPADSTAVQPSPLTVQPNQVQPDSFNAQPSTFNVQRPTFDQLPRTRIIFNLEEALQKPGSGNDLYLREGDILEIPRFENVVVVRGAVLRESALAFEPGKGVEHYIRQAGGYDELADRDNVTITYPDGRMVRWRKGFFSFGATEVLPMSVIEVHPRRYGL